MCRLKIEGRPRCVSDLAKTVRGIEARIESASYRIREIGDRVVGTSHTETESRLAKMDEAVKYREALYVEHSEAKRAFNASTHGMVQLNAMMVDPTLDASEREAARKDLMQAIEDRRIRQEQKEKQDALRDDLRRQGVNEGIVRSIVLQARQDKGNSHPRSASYYWTALEKARKLRADGQDSYDNRVNAILSGNLSEVEKKRQLAAEDAKFEKTDAELKRKVAHFRLGYDSTNEGRGKLLEQAKVKVKEFDKQIEKAYKRKDWDEVDDLVYDRAVYLSKRQARVEAVKRKYEAGFSDRKSREIIREQIRAACKSVGGDPQTALLAWHKPSKSKYRPTPKMPTSVATSIHLTKVDADKIERAFQRSPEFKKDGEDGFNNYVNRKILANPLTRMGEQSIEEVTASAPRFDQGKNGRHKTAVEGPRTNTARVMVPVAAKEMLTARAAALHMSYSSYCRAMALDGGNPFQIQNDRSLKHHREKLAKCRRVLQGGALTV